MTQADAARFLDFLQYAYPIILLAFFLLAFTVRSIATSSSANSNGDEPVYGPGGKPLPLSKKAKKASKRDPGPELSRPRKLVFEWLSVAACLTFVANAINVIVHALYARKQGWWCGQAVVVSAQIRLPKLSSFFFDQPPFHRSTQSVRSSCTRCFSSRWSTPAHRQLRLNWPRGSSP
jgi:hypothetical protein